MVRKLGEIIQDLIARLRGARGLERGLFREGDGIVRNGKKILMSHDNVLALARKYGIDMEGVNLGIAKFRRGGAQDAAVAAIAGTSALVTSGRPVPAEDCVRPWVVRRGTWDLGDERHTDAHLLVLPAAELTPLLGSRTVSGDTGSAEVRMLLAYARTVRRLLNELGPAGLLAARTALIELTRALVRGAADPQLTSPIVLAAKALIEQRLTEPGPDPALLARELHVSVRTLQRAFAAERTSLTAYVRDRRLELARRALSSPTRPNSVSEVASRWQFADGSHFSRAFKQRYGITPAAFARSQAESRR